MVQSESARRARILPASCLVRRPVLGEAACRRFVTNLNHEPASILQDLLITLCFACLRSINEYSLQNILRPFAVLDITMSAARPPASAEPVE